MATKRTTTAADNSKKETEQEPMEEMSAIDLLEEDHREVEDLFDKYEELKDASDKNELAVKICMALQVHTQIEEEIFYPAAREAIENPAKQLSSMRQPSSSLVRSRNGAWGGAL